MGARTHLIIPAFPTTGAVALPKVPNQEGPSVGGGGGGDDGGDDDPNRNEKFIERLRSQSIQIADVKAQYISTLIKIFEQKTSNGQLDEKLMERIERLLGYDQAP